MFSGVHSRKVYEIVKRAGTHRGHNKVLLAAPSTPSSATIGTTMRKRMRDGLLVESVNS